MERRRILHLAVIAAAMLLLLITGALPAACRTMPQAPSLPAKPVAAGPPAPRTAAAKQAAIEAARNVLPKIPPRVRAAVVQALQRLPTTPLSLLTLIIVACFFFVPRYARAPLRGAACSLLPRARSRALLNVFLI